MAAETWRLPYGQLRSAYEQRQKRFGKAAKQPGNGVVMRSCSGASMAAYRSDVASARSIAKAKNIGSSAARRNKARRRHMANYPRHTHLRVMLVHQTVALCVTGVAYRTVDECYSIVIVDRYRAATGVIISRRALTFSPA